jgi:hypothetical protein
MALCLHTGLEYQEGDNASFVRSQPCTRPLGQEREISEENCKMVDMKGKTKKMTPRLQDWPTAASNCL